MRGAVFYASQQPLVIDQSDPPNIAPDPVRVRLLTRVYPLEPAAGEVARSAL